MLPADLPVDAYQVLSSVGTGGMGEVAPRTRVQIKVLLRTWRTSRTACWFKRDRAESWLRTMFPDYEATDGSVSFDPHLESERVLCMSERAPVTERYMHLSPFGDGRRSPTAGAPIARRVWQHVGNAIDANAKSLIRSS